MMALNDEQRQLFQDALQKENDNLRGLDEKLRAAQKELVEATLASTYDESAVRTKAEAVAKIQTDITVVRAKALAAVAPSLKPEQKQQMTESPFGAMMLGGGGFGGRGFGGPGGPGGGGFRGRAGGGPGGPGGPDQRPKEQ
jgi:Spy/CpxP family protein refolding chaperone